MNGNVWSWEEETPKKSSIILFAKTMRRKSEPGKEEKNGVKGIAEAILSFLSADRKKVNQVLALDGGDHSFRPP